MSRARRRVLTSAGLLLMTLVPAVPAAATAVGRDGAALSLDWDGTTRATTDLSFVGVPVAVPGDRARRTMTVRNDGPTGGTLSAWVTQVSLLDPPASGDDGFYDDLRLGWSTASATDDASFRALADAGDTLIVRTHLARGASTRIEVDYELPLAATSGNRSLAGPRQASFVIRAQITGDTSGVPAAPVADGGPVGGASPRVGESAALALTGLDTPRAALLAVVGIAAGSLLLVAARRRRRAHDVGRPGPEPGSPSPSRPGR